MLKNTATKHLEEHAVDDMTAACEMRCTQWSQIYVYDYTQSKINLKLQILLIYSGKLTKQQQDYIIYRCMYVP